MSNMPQQVMRIIKHYSYLIITLGVMFAVTGCNSTPKVTKPDDLQLVWPLPPSEPRFFFEGTVRSSADIIEETATEKFQRLATGGTFAGKAMQKPFGIVVKNGVVYISDTAARRISVYDIDRKRYEEFGTEGAGRLAKPMGIALDEAGTLYVTDVTARRIVKFDSEGNYLGSMGDSELLTRPTGLAVSADGKRIFVVDTGGVDSDNHRVVVFDNQGEHLFNIGSRGSEPGEFNLPLGAVITPDNTLLVVDGGNFRVQAFSFDGEFLFQMGAIGIRSGQFARPKDIAVDLGGNIYVTDAAFGNIQLFNSKGELLMWVGQRSTVPLPGRYMLPSGVAIDQSDGRLYVVDQFFRKMDIFRPIGTPERFTKQTN